MSLAPEYLKKLVLVFVEELPGFEFFVQLLDFCKMGLIR